MVEYHTSLLVVAEEHTGRSFIETGSTWAYLRRAEPTRGMGPKWHLRGCLARFLPDIPTRHLHRWRFICCLFPLDSFSFSIPIFPTPPSSQELVCQQQPCTSPHAYQTVYPFFFPLWAPSSICGCHSQSPRWGSIPSRDLDTQPCQHHYINYLACFTLPSAMHNNTLIYDHNTYVRTPCTRQGKWIHSIKCKVGKEETNVYNLQCFSSFP